MANKYTKLIVGSKTYFINVDATDGAHIVSPGDGAVTLAVADVKSILDFMASFNYKKLLFDKKARGLYAVTSIASYFVDSTEGQIATTDFSIVQPEHAPEVKIATISTADGSRKSGVTLNSGAFEVLLRLAGAAGIKTSAKTDIKAIVYTDTLPSETAADNKKVYLVKGQYNKLNDDENAFVVLGGPFKEVKGLPAITTSAKENVLYNLTAQYTDPSGERFEKGIYTYTAKGNVHTFTDLTIKSVAELPDIEKAETNVVYILTKADTTNNRAKDSHWVVKDDEYVADTRQIKTVSKLPFVELAEKDTYYIFNKMVQKFDGTKFVNLGTIEVVDTLPDVTKVKLDDTTVYVLTRAFGKYAIGTKLVFNLTKKEFEEYVDPTTETTSDSSESNPEND